MTEATVAVAGASGFVGRYLVGALLKKGFKVVALSRYDRSKSSSEKLKWVKCDLFSRKDTEAALKNCDAAFYLTHSMIPSARLAQGSFADFDVVLADNFARAIRKNKVKKVIYLGGIVPQEHTLSLHLLSRLEVEKTLKNCGSPFVALRAGIVLGPEGSSFRMMYNLVKKLPLMVCPSWTKTLSNPISIWDTVKSLLFALENKSVVPGFYDIGGKTTLSYIEMMRILGQKMQKKRICITVPVLSPYLSRLWVSKIAEAPKELVYPLIESLKDPMVPNVNKTLPATLIKTFLSYEDSLGKILTESRRLKKTPRAFQAFDADRGNVVCSIQRLETLYRFSAEEVAHIYFSWIDKILPFLKIKHKAGEVFICLRGTSKALIALEKKEESSSEDYVMYKIKKSLLAEGEGRGRLIFRSLISGRNTMVEIHEFVPRLPWFLYKYTQAIFHLATMRLFNSYLKKLHRDVSSDFSGLS